MDRRTTLLTEQIKEAWDQGDPTRERAWRIRYLEEKMGAPIRFRTGNGETRVQVAGVNWETALATVQTRTGHRIHVPVEALEPYPDTLH